ncbi:MAG: PAS domain S-box protein [Dehalococcoidia bacterium]
MGDPLREVRTLKRRVQAFVYVAIFASEPFYYFVLDFTLVQLLPALAIGLAIAFIAIEGAFYQMFRLRRRSAYPGVLHRELGTVPGENAAGDRALRVIAHLLRVEDGCIAIAHGGRFNTKWILSGSKDDHQSCIGKLEQPIDKAIRTGDPVEADFPCTPREGVEPRRVVVIPLVALQRTAGVLILRERKGSDLSDMQLLKDIGVALALSLENWRQREELRKSEDRVRTVVTNVPVVLFAIDKDGLFTLSEGKGLDDLNLKPGQVVGLNVADVYRDVPEIQEKIRSALNGESFTDTVEVGGYWWETSYSPVIDEETGTVIGVIGVGSNVTARLQAEKTVRESEELYRTLVETSPDAVLLISSEGLVVKANLRASELLAFEDPSDMVGVNAGEFLSERDLERLRAHVERDGSAGAAGENEYEFLRRDGSTVPVEIALSVLKDADGNNTGYMGVARDVTERKLADEALRESEQKYRDLVENSNEIIYTLDSSAIVTYISPAVEAIGGFKPEEIIGRSSTEFIHPDDMADVAMSLQKVLRGELDPSEYRLRSKSGDYRWVRSASKPIYKGSEIVGVRGQLVDITEKREAEDALRASERRFRALVEKGADGVLLAAADGTISYAGPSTERIRGYTPEEMVGMKHFELIHPDDLEAVAALRSELLVSPGKTMQIVYRAKHKDGSWRWIEAAATNLYDEPSVAAIVVNYRDITERKLADEALRRSEENHRALALAIPDVMMRVRRDGTISDFKADERHVLSLPEGGPEEKALADVLPELAPRFMRFVDIAISTHETQVFEYQQRVSGRVLEFEARIVASSDDEAVAIIRDITERKSSERLRRSNIWRITTL